MATNYSYPTMGSDFDTYRGYGYQYANSVIPDDEYIKWRDANLVAQPSVADIVGGSANYEPVSYKSSDPREDAYNRWLKAMPADQRAEYRALLAQHDKAERGSFNKQALMGMAAFGGLGALAGMGGLGALGSSGLGAGQTAIGAGVGAGGGTGFGSLGGLFGGMGGLGAAAGGGGGLLGTLGTLGSAAGGLSKLGGAIGAIGGGLLGANQKAPTDTTTRQIDPRMAAYLYGADGTSGILGGVNDLWKKQMAQGGLNDVQREGLNRQLATLRDPRYSQGFDAMRSSGLGLLGMPIAGNPYTTR